MSKNDLGMVNIVKEQYEYCRNVNPDGKCKYYKSSGMVYNLLNKWKGGDLKSKVVWLTKYYKPNLL